MLCSNNTWLTSFDFRNKTKLYEKGKQKYSSHFDTMADPFEAYIVVAHFTNTNGTRAGPRSIFYVMSPPGGIILKYLIYLNCFSDK